MELAISQLIEYAVRKNWLEEPPDRIWAANRILEALGQDGFDGLMPVEGELPPLQAILDVLCEYAYDHGIIAGNSATYCDLLDTKLMGLLIPSPSEIIRRFRQKYAGSPRKRQTGTMLFPEIRS